MLARAARWTLITMPLAPAAIAVYMAFEWLFFATKPSVVSVLRPLDRVFVLLDAPSTSLLPAFGIQAIFTIASLVLWPRLRAIAFIPAAAVLGCLALILADNFTYVLLGVASNRVPGAARFIYLYALLIVIALCCRALWKRMPPDNLRRAIVPWLLVLPSFICLIAAAVTPRKTMNLQVASVAGRATPSSAQRPNILFLGSDGINARRLSVYGHSLPTSPYLESIRAETLFCENAFTNAGVTHGSLVSFLTGKLPTHTKVTFPPTMVQGDAVHQHLPGILKGLGYRTIQISFRHYGDAEDANLVGGFDLANYRWEQFLNRAGGAGDTAGKARLFRLEVMERLEDRLLHILNIRDSADPFAQVTERDERQYWSDERRIKTLLEFTAKAPEPWFAHVHLIGTHPGESTSTALANVSSHWYDSALREADDRFRQIVETLRARGQLDRTILVISSDHGAQWDTNERIPLMIRFPGRRHARSEPRNAQLADVAPTILEYLGITPPRWMDGTSLLEPLASDRPIISLTQFGPQRKRTPTISLLVNPGPPNYGTGAASAIIGSHWYRLSLATGRIEAQGEVAGHTVPSNQIPPDEIRRLLTEHLTQAGFRVGAQNTAP